MNVRNKTCLFCLKQRQILVEDSSTAKAIKKIYNINLPSSACRICIECHFHIGRISEFKHTIEATVDFDEDSCFVCKSESTVDEPGVTRVVDYLLKQCTTIDIGKTDSVRACPTCLYLLEISTKYEKLAKNFANAQRFCKQFATMKECNVALWKLDLETLGEICESIDSGGGGGKGKKGRKRARGSWGGREEIASKRSKQEDGSVLPVMLTKLTPTMTPTRPGGKKGSPNSTTPKGKGSKHEEKFFIKLPFPNRKPHWKKLKQQRLKYGAPHSPSKTIPASPSVDDLNKIFDVELRPLFVRIERVDLSSYFNRTISHDSDTRLLRKSKKEEFIGLDEEDVVEFQQNNTSIGNTIGKRKSILITERIESPNSAKKKVKFSDSPSIKYVDKLNFSDDEDGDREDSEDEKDSDYEKKKVKKKGPKPPNGTPENGKARRGRPKKVQSENEDEENELSTEEKSKEDKRKDNDKDEETEEQKQKDNDKDEEADKQKNNDKDKEADKSFEEKRIEPNEESDTLTEKHTDTKEEKSEQEREVSEAKETDEEQTVDAAVENGNFVIDQVPEPEDSAEAAEATEVIDTAAKTPPISDEEAHAEDASAPMDAEESEPADESIKNSDNVDTTDAEMKDVSVTDSPEDVEMAETKSPPQEDVEMQEVNNTNINGEEESTKNNSNRESLERTISPHDDFETSDKEEDEIAQVKQTLNDLLRSDISDSEQGATEQESQASQEENETSKQVPEEKQYPEPVDEEAEPATEQNTDPVQEPEPEPKPQSDKTEEKVEGSPGKKNQSYTSLDDVDDISDDDDILDRLDDVAKTERKRSPDLPPLGEDSL